MHSALRGVDVVGKGENHLTVAVGVLHGHLGHGVLLFPHHVDDVLVDGGLVLVDELHKGADSALVVHLLPLLLALPLIGHDDADAAVEEGLLPHPGVEGLIVVHQVIEHLRVRLEGDGGAGAVGGPHHGHGLRHLAPAELHLVDLAILMNLNPQPFRQGVDHAGAHAVEAAGDLITAAAELAAGVEDGIYHLQGGLAGLGLDVHRDAAAVVGDGDGVAVVNGDPDLGTVAGQGLVNGVVHDLIDQVVEAAGGGRADIHTRPLPHRLQALQDLDLRRVVFTAERGAVFQ